MCWDRSRDRVRQGEETIPGIGMLMLAAVAREHGYRVHLVDAKAHGTPVEEVAQRIAALRPDYLGLSATTISVTNAARIAARVKALRARRGDDPRRRARQRHPRAHARRVSRASTTASSARASTRSSTCSRGSRAAQPVDDVAGLAYRRDGRVHANPRAPYIDDLDALPPPAWDLLPDFPHRFRPTLFSYPRTPVATLITSRGCPFSCTFCDRSTSGPQGPHAQRRVGGAALPACSSSAASRHIIFFDDLFTVRKQRVVELCDAFLDHGFTFSWSCNSHPNLLDSRHHAAHAPRRLLADRLRHRVGLAARARRGQARGAHPAHARDAAHDARRRHPHQGLPHDRPSDRGARQPRRDGRVPARRSSSTSARSPSSRPIPARRRTRPSTSTARSSRTGSA